VTDLAPPHPEGELASRSRSAAHPRPGRDLGGDWSARIDDRIAELERLKAGLTECIGCGCLSLDRCRFANPDDRVGQRGPGPRYWIGDRRPAA
jgi:hypothetical protein